MTPTLLEAFIVLVLILVAWQLGVTLAPFILHWLRSLGHSFDEAVEEIVDEEDLDHIRKLEESRHDAKNP
jgi:hypothetical protein